VNLQLVVALLQSALLLIINTQAPTVSQAQRYQAMQVAGQAITLSTELLSLPPASTASLTPSLSSSPAPSPVASATQQCPPAPREPSASSCNGTWTPLSSGASDGGTCLISWQCVPQDSNPSISATTPDAATQTTSGGPYPGQILKSNYFCLVSINPITSMNIPAATPFPSNCYNGSPL